MELFYFDNMSGPVKYTLGKTERLKSRKQIDAIFSSGKQFTLFPIRVFYQFRESASPLLPLQAGFGVSARNFPLAVHRNRIKRRTREAYRLQKQALFDLLPVNNACLDLFFIYTGREMPEYAVISRRVGECLEKLIRIIHEKNPSHT